MTSEAFPTFDCLITGTREGYESDVELYFSLERQLASVISLLRFEDQEWKEVYESMIKYLDDLGYYLVNKKNLPDPSEFVRISKEMRERTWSYTILLKSDRATGLLLLASGLALQLMHVFARLGKQEKFKERFNGVAFSGLPYIEDVLAKRALYRS